MIVLESIRHFVDEHQARQMIAAANRRRDAVVAHYQLDSATTGRNCSFEGAAAFSSGQPHRRTSPYSLHLQKIENKERK